MSYASVPMVLVPGCKQLSPPEFYKIQRLRIGCSSYQRTELHCMSWLNEGEAMQDLCTIPIFSFSHGAPQYVEKSQTQSQSVSLSTPQLTGPHRMSPHNMLTNPKDTCPQPHKDSLSPHHVPTVWWQTTDTCPPNHKDFLSPHYSSQGPTDKYPPAT